jgi:hypothetical protein
MNHINLKIRTCEFNSFGDIKDSDFRHLSKIKNLNISHMKNLTDKIFQYLTNLEILNMTWGDDHMSGKGFKYLINLKELIIDECNPRTHRNALKYCSKAKITFSPKNNDAIDNSINDDEDVKPDYDIRPDWVYNYNPRNYSLM